MRRFPPGVAGSAVRSRCRRRSKRSSCGAGLVAGDPLPTESELMQELGYRAQLGQRGTEGPPGRRHRRHPSRLRHVRRTDVAATASSTSWPSTAGSPRRTDRSHLAHLTEIREILESGLVRRLIDRHSGADLEELLSPVREVIARMEAEALVGDGLSRDRPALPRPALPAPGQPAGRPAARRLLAGLLPAQRRPGHARREPGLCRPQAPRHLHRGGHPRTGRPSRRRCARTSPASVPASPGSAAAERVTAGRVGRSGGR